MIKNIIAFMTAFSLVLTPGLALADSSAQVSIDDINVDGCGEQEISFSGTAQFNQMFDYLEVSLDDEQILLEEGISTEYSQEWSTDSVTVSEGSHTLTATVWDQELGDDGFRGEEATESISFSIDSCSDESDEDNGDGDEEDCCPGPDEVVTKAKKPMIKGTTTGLWARLKPLNQIFRSVYGRTPTFTEWKYWANRLLTDKPQYDDLFGAMQWNKLHGQIVGK